MRIALLLLATALRAASPDSVNPSIVFIGDPHLNQQTAAATWIAQTNWIHDNVATWNINVVLCAGDFDGGVIDGGKDSSTNVTAGWTNGWNTIDGLGLPYLMTIGNHDYLNNKPSTRDSTVFDAQLGWSRINGKSFFGGFWDDGASSKANEYILATVGGHNLLIMALEFYPRPGAIAWADSVLTAHLDREVIVITHGYLNPGGSLVQQNDDFGPGTYSLPNDNYSGQALANWAQKYPNNIHMIICGHNDPPAFFQRSDGRAYGIMTDYQDTSPTPSQTILIIAFAINTITISNLNTSTGSVDNSTFPPVTLTWPLPATNVQYVFGGVK